MARPQSPRYAHLVEAGTGGSRSRRFRSKELMFLLVAGLVVLAYVLYAREGRGSQPSSATSTMPTTDDYDLIAAAEKAAAANASPPTASSPPSSAGQSGINNLPSSLQPPSGGDTSSSSLDPTAPPPPLLTAESPRAIVIESTVIANLVPLMLHFSAVLGPTWGLVLFTRQDRWIEPLAPPFQRLLASGHIEVRFLPPDAADLTSSAAVSRFLTAPWLWEQVRAARRVLLWQTDSILCAKAEASVEDFFEYDFVGAPIAPMYGAGYNGGLSVRNPRTFLEVTQEVDFATSGHEFEDQFFYEELKKRGAPMPDVEVAKRFSVETIYFETPLGYHQPQRWQQENMPAIEEWCPEVKMLIGRRAQ